MSSFFLKNKRHEGTPTLLISPEERLAYHVRGNFKEGQMLQEAALQNSQAESPLPEDDSPVIHDLVVAISVPFEKWAGRRNNQNTSTNDLWILFISSHVMSLKSVFHFLRKSLMILHENPFMSLVVSAAIPTPTPSSWQVTLQAVLPSWLWRRSSRERLFLFF